MKSTSRTNATEIYEQYVKLMPAAERLRLLALVAHDLALEAPVRSVEIVQLPEPVHSIMELHGLGKELWEGIDPEKYVNNLRREWERDVLADEA